MAGGRAVAAFLSRQGFKVFFEARDAASRDTRLRIVEDTPDLVLVLTPGDLEACAKPGDVLREEIAHALAAERNIVPLQIGFDARLSPSSLPAELAALSRLQPVVHGAGEREASSMAILAHRLSSETGVDDRRVDRRFKRWFIAALSVLVVGFALQTVPLLIKAWTRPKPKPPLAPFALYWAGAGQRLEAGRWAAFTPASGSGVLAGDQIRFVFSPSADGFAYVVARDARGGVSVLFPDDRLAGASRVRAGQTYEAPAGAGWLTVDRAAGADAVYLVAGYDPHQNLEELLERPEMELTPADRRDLLSSTIAALLDGRHAPSDRARTRTSQTIDRQLTPGPGPATWRVTLADGTPGERRMEMVSGLVSASVEIRLRFEAR